MKIKALITDVDGTLVANSPDATVSPRVKQAIQRVKNDVHVILATGRPLFRIQHIIEDLQLTSPCIIISGAQVYEPISKQMLYTNVIDNQFLPAVYAVFNKYQVPHRLQYQDKELFIDEINDEPLLAVYSEGMNPELAETVHQELQQIHGIHTHKLVSWEAGKVCVDALHPESSKLHGIAFLQKRLGLKKEELIGVGDGYNDFPLLLACGTTFAMGNAVPELKEIADFICPSVEKDGLAVLIEKFIL